MKFINKIKGDGAALPPYPSIKIVILASLGGFFAIASISLMTNFLSAALVLGSFGASCVLVFGYPDVPFSQPRNVVFGHVISSVVGLSFIYTFGAFWWVVSLSVAVSIGIMMLTRTVHPPAGSNPVIVFLTLPSWSFVIFPTLAGSMILVVVALVYNNLTRDAKYPKYW